MKLYLKPHLAGRWALALTLESCLCPPDECKSNIHFAFSHKTTTKMTLLSGWLNSNMHTTAPCDTESLDKDQGCSGDKMTTL